MQKPMPPQIFDAKLEQMREIKRNLSHSSSGFDPKEVDPDKNPLNHFQANELLLEVARCAREKTEGTLLEHPCELLISLVGLSPMACLTTVAIIRPKRLLLIYTAESAKGVNFIHKYAILHELLESVSIHQEQCDPRDTLDIYRCIRHFLEGNVGRDLNRKHIILDITGGKKSMSATGSLAAWQLELGLVYLDGVFDTSLGFSKPESQKLFCLANPSTIFMDQQMREADAMFEQGAYRSAAEAYGRIARFVPMPETARLREKVSRLYAAVCALQKEEILIACDDLESELPSSPSSLSREKRILLTQQLRFFREFARAEDPDKTPLLTFLLGNHYQEVHQPDFAVLFFYRTLEGCFTRRLRRVHTLPDRVTLRRDEILPTLSAENAEWFDKIRNDLGIHPQEDTQVYVTGFISSALLLLLLRDELMHVCGYLNRQESRKALQELGRIRNRSLLAHGEQPVTDTNAREFGKTAAHVLNSYLRLMLPDEKTVKHLQAQYSFLRKFD